MSGEILFLAHRIPFPPDRGDKIRSHHILKALAELAPVHVGCLAEAAADLEQEAELARLSASYLMPTRPKSLARAGVQALASRQPISLRAFHDARLARWVVRTLAERMISAIYVYSGQMGQYVPADWHGRLVVDLVDVDSAKFEAYGAGRLTPRGWLDRREGRLLAAFEHALAAQADVTLLVSEEEAALMRARGPAGADIRALRNGIDCVQFDPAGVAPEPLLAGQAGPHVVFTGQMDYAPNVAAVERFARRILPAIRARHAGARFHIVGRSPSQAVQRLAAVPGVHVAGAVPDTRPWLAAADLVVAPLQIARGVQNKVLEAMAMGKAVLASPDAATGIDAVQGQHVIVCDDDPAFVREALALLDAPARRTQIGQAARQLVAGSMSWPAMLAPLPALMGLEHAAPGCRDAA